MIYVTIPETSEQITDKVYLYGMIGSVNNYSKYCEVHNLPEKDGIYPCIVDAKGEQRMAELYFWHTYTGWQRGYIVDPDDTYYVNDAEDSYKERSTYL